MRLQLPGRPAALDAGIAAALAALVLWEIFATDVTGRAAVVVPGALAQTLPLAWRRTAALPTAAVIAVATVALALLDRTEHEAQTPLIALLLAVFSVGAHAGRRPSLAGVGLLLGALLIDEPDDFVVMGPVFTAAWGAGRLLHARQLDLAASHDRAALLERERDDARRSIAEERGRIARELHDVVAHNVSVMVMQAGAERLARPEAPAPTREALHAIERTGREALVEMQRLLGVLRGEDEDVALAPQPGLAQLPTLASHVTEAGLPVEVVVEGYPVELPPGLDISAFRIVQEALTNALRHAGPARARVLVRYEPDRLEVEVADDGRGSAAGNGGGLGLLGMRERVAIYGGELRTGNRPEGGFRVQARLPLQDAIP